MIWNSLTNFLGAGVGGKSSFKGQPAYMSVALLAFSFYHGCISNSSMKGEQLYEQ